MPWRDQSRGAPKKCNSNGSKIEKNMSSAAPAARNAGHTIRIMVCIRTGVSLIRCMPSDSVRRAAEPYMIERTLDFNRRQAPAGRLDTDQPAAGNRRIEFAGIATIRTANHFDDAVEACTGGMNETQ